MNERAMPALTLLHPWPWAILELGKDIENRGWSPPATQLRPGEWFALHGAAEPANPSRGWSEMLEALAWIDRMFPGSVPTRMKKDPQLCIRRGIVAMLKFGGVTFESPSKWYVLGQHGWKIEQTVKLRTAIPCRGSRRLWYLPRDVYVETRRIYRETMQAGREPGQGDRGGPLTLWGQELPPMRLDGGPTSPRGD